MASEGQIEGCQDLQTNLSDRSQWDLSNETKFIEIIPCNLNLATQAPTEINLVQKWSWDCLEFFLLKTFEIVIVK